MEKRSITGRDILRMDGLLPPTKRVPVCNAVTTSSDKKKEKKWSFGGILKSISLMKDCDSSSNDEEMVYCKREPRPQTIFNRKGNHVVLRPVKKNSDQYLNKDNLPSTFEDSTSQATNAQPTRCDSIHSRSSDGSLDGLGRKSRKNKIKARVEAKRDRFCADSSSDEDSRKSCNSLTKFQNEDCIQNSQKNLSCNRKSRSARTERYIKRLSKDEGHEVTESLSDKSNKRSSLDYIDGSQRSLESNGSYRPPAHPHRFALQSNSHTFPVKRSTENIQEIPVNLPNTHTRSSIDVTRSMKDQYITDLNRNNAYAKPVIRKPKNSIIQQENNYSPVTQYTNVMYIEPHSSQKGRKIVNRSVCPPEPPPRDPRCRVFSYVCQSYPHHDKHEWTPKLNEASYGVINRLPGSSNCQLPNSRAYDSNNELSRCSSVERNPRRPVSVSGDMTQLCKLRECTNNRHNSTGKHRNECLFDESEAMKCQRRNDLNDQLNSNLRSHSIVGRRSKFQATDKSDIYANCPPTSRIDSSEKPFAKFLSERDAPPYLFNTSSVASNQEDMTSKSKPEDTTRNTTEEDSIQRKRNSKNLEEALSELEAIYKSLRLGDEDLLDRAERRSMEEFSRRQSKNEDSVTLASPDSSDRTKDDMAYRRMHPKERPASLSEAVGQTALSNISYLMASPVLSRKDASDDYLSAANYSLRRDEPDVTRDDVVYRSIHHANNTLKVIDPQPPFGIPLGPVTGTTESDYLHTRPSKPEQPRSSYIPQCEPDIVTDDLAYRALRKDANTTKHSAESKTDVTKDSGSGLGMKKKRAVRSLSANLYGLINQDRIHLRREPNLQEISDETNETAVNTKPTMERSDCLRCVVSDGELSDYDTRWRLENSPRNGTDINGNHPNAGLHRKKLRVYVSPSAIMPERGREHEINAEAHSSMPSDGSLSMKGLDDEFWQEYLQPECNGTVGASKDTESDFAAYSRLCQDLVNLIKSPNDAEAKEATLETAATPTAKEFVKIDDTEDILRTDDQPVLHIQSLGSHYTDSSRRLSHPETIDSKDIDKLTESIVNSENEDAEKADDNALDFYLRLADENVKLIAEAFSSVADHLRDSRLSQKNSPTPHRSEIENDSGTRDTSARSSTIYSQDDANTEHPVSANTFEEPNKVPEEKVVTITDGDHGTIISGDHKDRSTIEANLDLSRAVHDLQVAAASLREHGKEIEELETLLKKNTNEDTARRASVLSEDEESLSWTDNPIKKIEGEEREGNLEERVLLSDAEVRADSTDPPSEGEIIECELVRKPYGIRTARTAGMRVSYVTNLITVMITTYSMVLLACFLALLLATVAAS